MCVSLTTSVTLTGVYTVTQWYENGPTKFSLNVAGVSVYNSNDYANDISAVNAYSHTNVQCLMMDRNYLKYMPGSYSRFFPGIQFLIVRQSHVKYITNADFSGLNQLLHVDFSSNDIEHLPENLFEGVSFFLETVSFGNNKLTNIGTYFFSHLPGLKALVLNANPCIDLYSPVNTLSSMSERIYLYCRGSINPDVITGPPPTYDEYNALNVANDQFKKTIENLTTELETVNTASNKCFDNVTQSTLDMNAAKDEIIMKNLIIDGNNEGLMKLNQSLTDSSAELDESKVSAKKLKNELENTKNDFETIKLNNDKNKQTIEDLKKITNALKADLMKKDADLVYKDAELVNATKNANERTGVQATKIEDLEEGLAFLQDEIMMNNLTIDGNNEAIMKLTKSLENSIAEVFKCGISANNLHHELEDTKNNLETIKLSNDLNKQTIQDSNKITSALKADLANKDAELVEATKKSNERTGVQATKIEDLEKTLASCQSKFDDLQKQHEILLQLFRKSTDVYN